MTKNTKDIGDLSTTEPSLHKPTTLGNTETKEGTNPGANTTGLESQDPPKKKRHINRESTTETEGTEQQQLKEAIPNPPLSTAMVPVGASSHIGKIEHGKATQISEDGVLDYKDLPAEAYEFNALLRPAISTRPSSSSHSNGRGAHGNKDDLTSPGNG